MSKLSWIDFAENYLKEDFSLVKNLIKENKAEENRVLKAIFTQHKYVSPKEALYILESEFADDKFVKENVSLLKKKIGNLTEHEIKIIINAQDKSSSPTPLAGDIGFSDVEFEGAKPKRRGRPPKAQVGAPVEEPVVTEEEDVDESKSEQKLKYAAMGYDSDEPLCHVTASTAREAMEKAKTVLGKGEYWLELVKESISLTESDEEDEEEKEEDVETTEDETTEDTEEESSEDEEEKEDEDTEEESEVDIDWEYVEKALKNLIDDAQDVAEEKDDDESEDEESDAEHEEHETSETPEEEAAEHEGEDETDEDEEDEEVEENVNNYPVRSSKVKREQPKIEDWMKDLDDKFNDESTFDKEDSDEDETDDVDEALDPSLKNITAGDPRFADVLKRISDRTRSGQPSNRNDIMKDLSSAVDDVDEALLNGQEWGESNFAFQRRKEREEQDKRDAKWAATPQEEKDRKEAERKANDEIFKKQREEREKEELASYYKNRDTTNRSRGGRSRDFDESAKYVDSIIENLGL